MEFPKEQRIKLCFSSPMYWHKLQQVYSIIQRFNMMPGFSCVCFSARAWFGQKQCINEAVEGKKKSQFLFMPLIFLFLAVVVT